MKSLKLVGSLVSALMLIGALAGSALAGGATPGKAPVRTLVRWPAAGPGGQASGTCFWGTSYTQQTWNYIWPNSQTNYEASVDTIPAGGKVVFHGQFPHARFFSFTTSSTLGTIRGHLYDTQIKPDPGSTNPFLPGANRNAKHRSFTVTMVDAPDPGPGHRAPNTVYGGVAGQAPGTGPMLLIVRVYVPDRGRNYTGGVGVPTATYVGPGSSTAVTGQQACTDVSAKPGYQNITNVNPLLFPESKIQSLLALSKSPEHPAVKNTVWYKYFNPSWLLAPYYAGTSDASLISSLPVTGTGLGANPANGFAFAWLDRRFGPNHNGHNIAVLHGKLPTTPATYAGEAKTQGGKQLRFWSLCNNQGLTSGATTGQCLFDEEVPINAQREYTIVLSLPQDRPENATAKCGVAWMNYGTAGDGYTRPDSTMLLLRNLATTAHPKFKNAIQNIATPGSVKSTMGAYLPTVTYTDAAKFQKTGCSASTR
jgi:hypothetical protein